MKKSSVILFLILFLSASHITAQTEFNTSINISSVLVESCPEDPCDIFFEIPESLSRDPKQPSSKEDYIRITPGQNMSIDVTLIVDGVPENIILKIVANRDLGIDPDIGELEISTDPVSNIYVSTSNGAAHLTLSISHVPVDDNLLSQYETWEIVLFSTLFGVILFLIFWFIKRQLGKIVD